MAFQQDFLLPTVFPVSAHSTYIGFGSTFVAIHGFKESGIKYISQAVQQGATTIVVEQGTTLDSNIKKLMREKNIALITVDNPRKYLAELSAEKAEYPATKLKIFAVTGTKGKTTTAFLLAHIFKTAGYQTALISSVQNSIGENTFEAPLTTPQPDYLHQFFAACVTQGVTHVVLEVAAHATTLYRTHGLLFEGIIFTNFSREHLEFYANLQDYFNAKCILLTQIKQNCPVLINEDSGTWHLLQDIGTGFSLENKNAFLYAKQKEDSSSLDAQIFIDGTSFDIDCPTLIGQHNLYNILSAVGMALHHGVDKETCQQAVKQFQGIPGRFEQYYLKNGARCVIDAAHNSSSFCAILSTLRPLTEHLIVVFGAGGDRDAGRRPEMGCLAGLFCDSIILTSDNPRSEKVKNIIEDIISGFIFCDLNKIIVEEDRKKAIEIAYDLSHQKSIIALLGKGNSEYQIVENKKIPFSERNIIASFQ